MCFLEFCELIEQIKEPEEDFLETADVCSLEAYDWHLKWEIGAVLQD